MVTLVIRSEFDVPESEAAARFGATGAVEPFLIFTTVPALADAAGLPAW